MTAWIHAMPVPIPGQLPSRTEEALPVPTLPSATDDDARRLVAAIGRGDDAAFQALYERYHERVFRFTLVLSQGDAPLASEIVQSTFLIAAARLRRVESDVHLWNWLARVARQQLAKVRRQQRRDPTVVGLIEIPDRAAPGEPDSILEEQLDVALRTMEPADRQLLEWFYFDGLSHKEMAGQLGASATAKSVSSRLERARARLRARLIRTLAHET